MGPDDLGPDTSPVAYETADAVAYVTLNRPDFRNAQNSVMTYSLDAAFRKAVDDADVKVIVLRANGKHFSAGHDIGTPERDFNTYYENAATLHWDHTRADGQPSTATSVSRARSRSTWGCAVAGARSLPVIAQVHGACIAGGLMLAWSADFIVASDDAFFSDPVARMGIPGVEYFAHAYVLGAPGQGDPVHRPALHRRPGPRLGHGEPRGPRDELDAKVAELCAQMTEMPMQGLFLSKKAVNICEDQMGMRNAMDSVFGWHHFAHAANDADSGDSLGGMDARSMRDAAQKDSGQKKGDA